MGTGLLAEVCMYSDEDDVLEASINELVGTFRAALLALIPIADRANLPWIDDNTHRDWETLSQALFNTFVKGPIRGDRERNTGQPILSYDIDHLSYAESSWVGVGTLVDRGAALVRLVSVDEPFDSVQVVEVDDSTGSMGERRIVSWEDANFYLANRSSDGTLARVLSIVAEE